MTLGDSAATCDVAVAKRTGGGSPASGAVGGEDSGATSGSRDIGEGGGANDDDDDSGATLAAGWRPVLTRATTAAARSTSREPGGWVPTRARTGSGSNEAAGLGAAGADRNREWRDVATVATVATFADDASPASSLSG